MKSCCLSQPSGDFVRAVQADEDRRTDTDRQAFHGDTRTKNKPVLFCHHKPLLACLSSDSSGALFASSKIPRESEPPLPLRACPPGRGRYTLRVFSQPLVPHTAQAFSHSDPSSGHAHWPAGDSDCGVRSLQASAVVRGGQDGGQGGIREGVLASTQLTGYWEPHGQ